MKKYTVNTRSHFRHLWLLLFLLIFVPIGVHYMMIFKGGDYSNDIRILIGQIFLLVYILPMVLLHLNYYFENKGDYLFYDKAQGAFIYGKNKTETIFDLSDVESITCSKSKTLAEDRSPFFPWDIYNYTKIQLKNGDKLKLSSLLVYELDKEVRFTEIKIKKTFYPWIV
jgi:hypothetical protein